MDLIRVSSQRPVVGSCEHGNETSDSMNIEKFPDYLSVLPAFQEGRSSMELV